MARQREQLMAADTPLMGDQLLGICHSIFLMIYLQFRLSAPGVAVPGEARRRLLRVRDLSVDSRRGPLPPFHNPPFPAQRLERGAVATGRGGARGRGGGRVAAAVAPPPSTWRQNTGASSTGWWVWWESFLTRRPQRGRAGLQRRSARGDGAIGVYGSGYIAKLLHFTATLDDALPPSSR